MPSSPLFRSSLLWLPLIAVAGFLLSQWLVRRMIRVAVMDVPGERSAHDRPVPRGGGVGVVGAVLAGVPCCLLVLPGGYRDPWTVGLVLLATAWLAIVSWLDDLQQFGARTKLGAQCVAAICAVAAAVLASPLAPPPDLLVPCCIAGFVWVVLCTNAVNFIDGLNGLAAGTSLICGLFASLLGFVLHDPLVGSLGLMLAAGLAGFLPYNVPSAQIFMGDVGSQSCGLLLATLALLLLVHPLPPGVGPGIGAGIALAVPLMLAGILFDVVFTLARRLLAGERITQAHRGHLYQVAARAGVPRLAVAMLHWAFAGWGIGVSVVLLPVRPMEAILLALLPQPVWTATVLALARKAGISRWS